jgi:hypothetical protein
MSQRTNSSKGLILPSIDFAIKVVTPGMCIIINLLYFKHCKTPIRGSLTRLTILLLDEKK